MGALFLTSYNLCFKGWREEKLTLDIAGFPWLRRLAEAVKATKTVAGVLCQIYCLFIFYLFQDV